MSDHQNILDNRFNDDNNEIKNNNNISIHLNDNNIIGEQESAVDLLSNLSHQDYINLKENKLKELNSEIEESKKSNDPSIKENSVDLTGKINDNLEILPNNELSKNFTVPKINNLEMSNMSFEFENIDNEPNNNSVYSLKISEKDSLLNIDNTLAGEEIRNNDNDRINQPKLLDNITEENNDAILNNIKASIKDIEKKPLYQIEQQHELSMDGNNLLKTFEKKSFVKETENNLTNQIKCESPLSQEFTKEEEKDQNIALKSYESKSYSSDLDNNFNNEIKSLKNNYLNDMNIDNNNNSITSLKTFERKPIVEYVEKNDEYEPSEDKEDSVEYNIDLKNNEENNLDNITNITNINKIIGENKIKNKEYNRMLQRNEELLKNINKSSVESVENSSTESLDSDIPDIINSYDENEKFNTILKRNEKEDDDQTTDPMEELNVLSEKLKSLYENHPILKSNSFGSNSSYSIRKGKEAESNSTMDFETMKKITINSDKHHNLVINQWNNERFKKSNESLKSSSSNSSSNQQTSSYKQLYSKLRQSFATNSLNFNTLNKECKDSKSSLSSHSSDILNINSNNSVNENINDRNNINGNYYHFYN